MAVPVDWAKGTVRFSVGRGTTAQEIDRAVEVVSEAVHLFLIGDGVARAHKGQRTPEGYYNIERMIRSAAQRGEAAA